MLIRLLLTLAVSATLLPAQSVEFLSDIRPLLSDNCFTCHGPDEASRLAGIRLDGRDHAFSDTSNGTLIVAGDLEESLVYQRISSGDPARRTTPACSGKELTSEQIKSVRHPPRTPNIPVPRTRPKAHWSRTGSGRHGNPRLAPTPGRCSRPEPARPSKEPRVRRPR